MSSTQMAGSARLAAAVALVATLGLASACGSSGAAHSSASPATASSAHPSLPATPFPVAKVSPPVSAHPRIPASPRPASAPAGVPASSPRATPSRVAAASPSASASSSSGSTTGQTGAADWKATADEHTGALDVTERFITAIDTQDFSAASDLMASDAAFTLDSITSAVARVALVTSTLRVLPDGQGTPHLAMKGAGLVSIVARGGGGFKSGEHVFAVKVRRDSRRDEWRVWDFDLHR